MHTLQGTSGTSTGCWERAGFVKEIVNIRLILDDHKHHPPTTTFNWWPDGQAQSNTLKPLVRPLAELVHTPTSVIICFMYTPSLSACEEPSTPRKAFPTARSCAEISSICGVFSRALFAKSPRHNRFLPTTILHCHACEVALSVVAATLQYPLSPFFGPYVFSLSQDDLYLYRHTLRVTQTFSTIPVVKEPTRVGGIRHIIPSLTAWLDSLPIVSC
ncbi:hypothetical protein F5888DRAFT_1209993 [Russula emetica]|nr:hypothetical protein F5888DRAFT_1209993 [Russula emetica]